MGVDTNDGIVLLVSNEFFNDPRVFRSATACAESGHPTSVVCFMDDATLPVVEEYRGVRIHRIPRSSRRLALLRARPNDAGPVSLSSDDGTTCTGREKPASLGGQVVESGIFLNNSLRWFARIRRMHPAAVYANDLDTLPAGALLARRRHVPLIYDSHELFAEMMDPPRPLFKRMLVRLESLLIRRAGLVVTVNPSIARELSERYSIDAPLVIYNCPPYQEAQVSGPGRNGPVRAIYHGGYAPDRGIEELVEASRHLVGADLYLRGIDRLPPEIAEALSGGTDSPNGFPRATLLPRVPMTGLVPSLEGFDIGIVPYRATCLNNYYSSPNKLFEYMMGGCAIAAADLPEIRRIVEECENGVLFDPSDPVDIAAKINALASDSEGLLRMKRNSLKAAAERYSWEAQRSRLLRAIDDRLGRGGSQV